MVEYSTEAFVLDKEDLGDYDARVFLYSRDLGKISAKATSIRKIVSKLASHLEPGNLVKIRLINKNSFQVADALKIGKLPKDLETISALHLVKELSPEAEANDDLWNNLTGGTLNGLEILRILGFDNQFATCGVCGNQKPNHFLIKELDYYCAPCFLRAGRPTSFVLK